MNEPNEPRRGPGRDRTPLPRRRAVGLIAAGVTAPLTGAALAQPGRRDRPIREPQPDTTGRPVGVPMPRPSAPPLLTVQRGTLPIILSAPHGGHVRVPNSDARTRGVLLQDTLTSEIALLTMQSLTDRLDGVPQAVVAQFHRRHADANRSDSTARGPHEAYENPGGEAQYKAYHAELQGAIERARGLTSGGRVARTRGLLIDIHGQSRTAGAVYRGTRNGLTVARLVTVHGVEAVIGPDSLFGRLASLGYPTLPAPDPNLRETPLGPRERFFNGGHIVFAYGSQHPLGVDAIQVELGRDFRTRARMEKTASDLADAIAHTARRYLLD